LVSKPHDRYWPTLMKRALRRKLELILARYGRHKWRFPTGNLVVLTYHRILSRNHSDLNIAQPGMVVSSDTFRLHLRILKQHFELVKLDDWVKTLNEGVRTRRRACAITFDDGWRDNFEFAFPLLKEEQVPATLFLVSDYIDTARSFWPERLARLIWNDGHALPHDALGEIRLTLGSDVTAALSQAIPSRDTINEVIERAKRYTDNQIAQKITAIEMKLGRSQRAGPRDVLSWRQVREMTQSGLITVGSHSRYHTRLSAEISEGLLEDEIVVSKQEIEAKTGTTLGIFCYPGGVASPLAEQLVRRHYQAACTTIKGWNSPRSDRFRLKRISMHEDVTNTETSFLARISGWL
jgi:peptidoglycan/xylan/chitin deacetylase (PgdA/CDA1 family)